jgi:hypothetical protein
MKVSWKYFVRAPAKIAKDEESAGDFKVVPGKLRSSSRNYVQRTKLTFLFDLLS